ncbi:MAG: GNAT family N-acetyltransferase [Legionellales bacterium]|nr:GNAT family N-acetyltransferase [Legionellales bacterium]
MTKNKTLEKIITPRLILRPLVGDDIESYFEAEQASIKEMGSYWSWAITKSMDDIKVFIEFSIACHKHLSPQNMYFAIIEKESNQFLGCIWCQSINWFVPKFEISYWLDTRKTGNGFMSEAVNALSRAIFDVYYAKRIEIKVFTTNQKSRAIPERLGFKLDAILKNNFINFITNEIMDGALYSCVDIENLPELSIQVTQ